MQRIRPGSLMIRVLAVFFAMVTAFGTYRNLCREPIAADPSGGPQLASQEPAPSTICDTPTAVPAGREVD